MDKYINKSTNIKGSTFNAKNAAFGDNNIVGDTTSAAKSRDMQEIQARLNELMQALNKHESTLENPEEIRESTSIVAKELSKEKPNKITLTGVLTGIASSVQSVTAIAVAVEALQKAIGTLL